MKPLIKIVVLWLTLLALPLQGFAASGMTCCGAKSQASAEATHATMTASTAGTSSMAMEMPAKAMSTPAVHEHPASSKVTAMQVGGASPLAVDPCHGPTTPRTADDIDHAMPSAPITCASCAAHCTSLAVGVDLPVIDDPGCTTSAAIPFRPTPSTPVVPGTPERPPQPFLV